VVDGDAPGGADLVLAAVALADRAALVELGGRRWRRSWKISRVSREEVLGPHKLLVTNNGIFRPFALVEGRAVARWGLAGGKVTIEHLSKVRKKDAAALEEESIAAQRFLSR
jgi:hypothetical protein